MFSNHIKTYVLDVFFIFFLFSFNNKIFPQTAIMCLPLQLIAIESKNTTSNAAQPLEFGDNKTIKKLDSDHKYSSASKFCFYFYFVVVVNNFIIILL